MHQDVGVVIVSYNSAHVIEGLLASIPQALGGLTALVTVVDNGSIDRSVEMLEASGGCTLIRSDNRGYAAGVNVGVDAMPDVEAILVLNPDVRLAPRSVETMFATLRSTEAGVVAPMVLDPDGRRSRSLRREPTLLRALGLGRTHHHLFDEYISAPDSYRDRLVVDWALGAALLIRREVHMMLDGWDESYFLYSEEADFSLRAADRGWTTIYEPGAVATHIGGASGRSSRTHTMQILNRVRLYARRHTALGGAAYFGLALLGEASRVIRGRTESLVALEALLRPSMRPTELDCSASFVPR